MQVLENQRELGLTFITMSRLADGAGCGIEEKRAIIGFAVVVAGGAEAQRKHKNQKRRGEWPPGRLDIGRVKGRQVRTPLVVYADPRRPGRVDSEAAEDECRYRRLHPPGIAAQRRA